MECFDRFGSYFDHGHFQHDDHGRYFVNDKSCLMFDLSSVNVISSTVDTVRQLYRLMLDQSVLHGLHESYQLALKSFQKIHVHGYDFSVGSGGQSGYKYRLQNSDLGVIVFIKNQRQKIDVFGSHIKVELSPQFLLYNSVADAQCLMDAIAVWFGDAVERSGVSLHLAADVQGWEPDDFLGRLKARSTRRVAYDGIDTAEFDLASVAATYGDRETVTVGSVTSVQMSFYDKLKEAVKHDKLHFWNAVWSGDAVPVDSFCMADQGGFDKSEGVRRLEMRFHHTVLRQFERGSGCEMTSYESAFEHLGALWRYAMRLFKLRYDDDLIDPVWQMLAEDVDFNQCHSGKSYKRAYKKPGEGNEKNVALALGNWLSIVARQGMKTQKAWRYLKVSGMFKDIKRYYQSRGIDLQGLYQLIDDGLTKRRLAGRAAA